MNKTLTICIVALATPFFVQAKSYVFAITDNINEAIAGSAFDLAEHAFTIAEEKETIRVVSATGRPSLITEITKERYGNDNARKRHLHHLKHHLFKR